MHPEIAELQSKLKEILYDCAVEIRATKAALYLYDRNGRYELITEYGFRGEIRQVTDWTDPIVDRCARGRAALLRGDVRVGDGAPARGAGLPARPARRRDRHARQGRKAAFRRERRAESAAHRRPRRGALREQERVQPAVHHAVRGRGCRPTSAP